MWAFQKHREIEKTRSSDRVVRRISLAFVKPTTANGYIYPEMLRVGIDAGRLPQWIEPFFQKGEFDPRLRRIEAEGDNYGFITSFYTCSSAAPGAYVPSVGEESRFLRKALIKAATDSGWSVDERGDEPALQTDLCYRGE